MCASCPAILYAAVEEEDPTLRVTWQERARQVHVYLMGPVQTEVLQQQLKKRYGILVTFGAGKVRYKETIRGAVEGVGHFEPCVIMRRRIY